jgi:hypothetical protein
MNSSPFHATVHATVHNHHHAGRKDHAHSVLTVMTILGLLTSVVLAIIALGTLGLVLTVAGAVCGVAVVANYRGERLSSLFRYRRKL